MRSLLTGLARVVRRARGRRGGGGGAPGAFLARPVLMGGVREGTDAAPAVVPSPAGAGGGSALRPMSAAELLAEEPPPLVWVWEPFLPERGLVVCAAFMKVGKSTLTGALAVAVAQGRPFLGYPTKQRGVLILALEEHPRDVGRRLRTFGLRPEDPLWVQCDRVRLPPASLRELEGFVGAHDVGLVIIDTLGRYWSVKDENDNAEIERALGPVLELARRTDACVLLVHHERKGAGEQGATGETIRGGSALLGLVDQALLLRRGAARDERELVTVGRYAETPPRVRLRFDGHDYQRVGGDDGPPAAGRPARTEARDAQVWEALGEEPRTVEELAARTGLSPKQVRAALGQLDPAVVREGTGHRGDPHRYRRAPSPLAGPPAPAP